MAESGFLGIWEMERGESWTSERNTLHEEGRVRCCPELNCQQTT